MGGCGHKPRDSWATRSWKRREGAAPTPHRGSTALQHLEFGLSASRLREQISVVFRPSLWSLVQKPQDTDMAPGPLQTFASCAACKLVLGAAGGPEPASLPLGPVNHSSNELGAKRWPVEGEPAQRLTVVSPGWRGWAGAIAASHLRNERPGTSAPEAAALPPATSLRQTRQLRPPLPEMPLSCSGTF